MIDDFSSFADIKLFIRSHQAHKHRQTHSQYRVCSRDKTHSSSAVFHLIENLLKESEREKNVNGYRSAE